MLGSSAILIDDCSSTSYISTWYVAGMQHIPASVDQYLAQPHLISRRSLGADFLLAGCAQTVTLKNFDFLHIE